MPQTAQDWFKANAPKKPTAASAQDWASKNAPSATAPRAPTASEQQISEGFRNTPMSMSWLRSPWEATKGFVQGLVDPAVSFYQAAKQRDIELGGQGNPIMGAPDALLDMLAAGEAESQRIASEKIRSGQPDWLLHGIPVVSAMARGIARTAEDDPFRAAGQLATLELYPRIGSMAKGALELPSPTEGLRDYAQRTVRRGPGQVERAAAEVDTETANVAARNAERTAAAEQRNQGAFSEAQRAHNEAMAQWEREHGEGTAAYEAAKAKHAEELGKVQQANAASEAQVAQRQAHLGESAHQSEQLVEGLRDAAQKAEAKAKSLYPKIEGEVQDTGVLAQSVRDAAEKQMRESGPIPAEIERIVRQYTPKEAEGELMVDGEPVAPDSELAAALKAQGAPGFEDAGPGEPNARATFENLHSQYSALGRLGRQAENAGNGYRAAAYQAARGVLRDAMESLAEDAGAAEQFQAAQKEWGRMEKTFYEKGSPIAKALAKIDDIYASLKDDPAGARQAAAPYVRQILAEAKNANYARKLLSQFEGAPVGNLDAMVKSLEDAKALPKKAKLTAEPKPPEPYTPKPKPQLEPPVPAHTADLQAPPAPFNRRAFIKEGVQKAAEDLQATKGMTATYKHPIGRFLERPGVQDWIAGPEPPVPMRPTGQPGQPGAQGAPTPFGQAPPPPPPSSPTTGPSSPVSGPGPSTPSPSGGLRPTASMSVPPGVQARIDAAGLVNKGEVMPGSGVFQVEHPDLPGKTFSIKATDTPKEIEAKVQGMYDRFGVKREGTATEPNAQGKEPGYQRAGDVKPTIAARLKNWLKTWDPSYRERLYEEIAALSRGESAVPPALKRLGIKHQPLSPEMDVELEMILQEKPNLSKTEARSVQTVMDSWGRGTFTAEEAADRIRASLGLPKNPTQ